ncbi:hypothetical protein HYALB_00007833 [Hymenoscyphus albidus]|uniref:Cupin type-2 domain-containing protein n=1 Tax=Hymenoscyphus albidus TaxID=595503 RepID=A0A9N9LHS1_9HELO|nr:hypothetical protein HYALB_00007833 [Hymenoscyphus albidus]
MATINHVKRKQEEVIDLGPVQIYVLEDGKLTDNRLSLIRLTIQGKSKGPPLHWHRMHDEGFYVSKGTVRFHTEKGDVDANAGEFVMVPIKAVHSFSNPFDEPAEFLNTFTPAFYIDYLRMVGANMKSGMMMGAEKQKEIMAQFATFPPGDLGLDE